MPSTMRLTVATVALAGLVPGTSTGATVAAPHPVIAAQPAQSPLAWGPCEEGVGEAFECAALTVPLDHANPAAGTIDLALIRLPADPSRRQGAILLNPGGPGGSGYDFAANAAEGLDTQMGLDRSFDLVGFDPRGVERSGGLDCLSDAEVDARLYTDDTPDDAAAAEAAVAEQRALADACRARYGDTLRLYSTEATARDMDLIRAGLGDEQISYLGISYGTYLGAVYATLFPERVRAMVLDSAFEPTGDTEYEQYVTQLIGFEGAFANWAAWCEEGTECAFSSVDVGARWDALMARLEAKPAKSDRGVPVNHVVMETATVSAMYSELAWPVLASALAQAESGDGTALLAMADDYNGRSPDGTFATIRESGPVIRCASGIASTPPADPAALLAELRAAAPRFSRGYDLTDFAVSCLDMIPTAVTPVVPAYAGPAPVVVVGGLNDPATPFRWATELAALMGAPNPNVALVSYTGEGHGYVLSSTCVTDAEAAVLRDLRLPAQGTVCDPDPDVPRPAFWDQIPVPAGVGPLVEDPAIDLALGLPPTQVYADVWYLTGDVATVVDAYRTGFEGLGFDVIDAPEIIEGVPNLVAIAPDGTQVVILLIPPEALAANDDLEQAAELAPSGQGFVVVAALGTG